jgi:hypothetical protein
VAGERFASVYFSVEDDPRLKDIYPDDALFGLWTRLLVLAEKAWPQPAYLPRTTDEDRLAVLVAAGVIVPVDSDRYRFHGLDEERAKRSARGKAGSDARWNKPDATALPTHSERIPSRARAPLRFVPLESDSSTTTEKKNGMDESARANGDDEAGPLLWLAQHNAHVRDDGNRLHQKLIRLVQQHGNKRVVEVFEELAPLNEAAQYILGAGNVLNPIPVPRTRKLEKGMSNRDDLLGAQETV